MMTDKKTKLRGEYINGRLYSFPVDDFAIRLYNIAPEEMYEFMTPEYADVHTAKILKLILSKREA